MPGLLRSLAWRVGDVPWLPAGPPGGWWEDWYLVEGWTALGELEHRAVRGAPGRPHQSLAATAGGGAGAVYRLRAGEEAAVGAPRAAWHNKPGGTGYRDLERALAPMLNEPGAGWWQRALVLGPAPEFCLLSPEGPGPLSEAGPAGELAGLVVVERERVV